MKRNPVDLSVNARVKEDVVFLRERSRGSISVALRPAIMSVKSGLKTNSAGSRSSSQSSVSAVMLSMGIPISSVARV